MTIDTTYLNSAKTELNTRKNSLANTVVNREPGRFSLDNANLSDSWEGKWLNQDAERGKQLDWLQQALSGGDLTKPVENYAATTEKSNILQAERAHRVGVGTNAASMARSGRSGGSDDAGQQAAMASALAEAKVKAKAQADELRNAGVRNVESMERQLVDSIMADNGAYQAAQQASLDGQQVNIQGAQLQSGLDNQYRGLLAEALGGVVNSSVQPIVTEGFKYADRANAYNDQTYQTALENWRYGGRQGSAPTATANQSWWSF